MEARHAANIDRKATQAAEIIEQIMPDLFNLTPRDTLEYFIATLYGDDTTEAAALWASLGFAYTLFYGKPGNRKATEFNTSKTAILDRLVTRLAEIDGPLPRAGRRVHEHPSDPFAGLVS